MTGEGGETPACGKCGSPLERLGSSRTSLGAGPPVEVIHFVCSSCKTRWLHHSTRGWRETDRDLSS